MKHLVTILLIGMLAGCASLGEKAPPSAAEVVEMAKDGQKAEAIIQRMQESGAVYRLSASQLADLRAQGVPDKVIDYMQQTYIEAERYREWARARDVYFYLPFFSPYRRPYWRRPYWW